MAGKNINWDEVFEKFTENKVLKASYSKIARTLGVSEKAVRKQFKKRGVVDPRKVRARSEVTSPKSENGSDSDHKIFNLRPEAFNAVKHGLYARVFWTEEGRQLYEQLVKSDSLPNLIDAIYMLKAKIASREISKIKDVLNALEIMSKLYDKVLGAERNEIERKRLTHEKTRVDIAREKLELERLKLKGPDKDTEEVHKDFIKSVVEEVEPEELYSDEEEQSV
ncbi:hypothetical protein [Thermosipho sp. 1074]|uniref:hypothetical protein n=1 Tax=Thermosipho sp. 1074 TaxID=1643331 RepID=UPI0009857D03|nr:hypothetical protein [Thermosipho sp. 1074]OOC42181.1 hypothetical protein XO08_07815 [Thermosipho sp. 1074]